MKNKKIITTKKGYEALFYFIEKFYEMTKSDALGEILSGMEYLEDGKSAEPLLWDYWLEAIEKAELKGGLPVKELR